MIQHYSRCREITYIVSFKSNVQIQTIPPVDITWKRRIDIQFTVDGFDVI